MTQNQKLQAIDRIVIDLSPQIIEWPTQMIVQTKNLDINQNSNEFVNLEMAPSKDHSECGHQPRAEHMLLGINIRTDLQKLAEDNSFIDQEKSMKIEKQNYKSLSQRKKSIDQQQKNKQPRCSNKYCNFTKNLRKIKSKISQKEFLFCKKCYQEYVTNCFCLNCQQIYPNEGQTDIDQWVQCQICQRWIHRGCEKKSEDYNIQINEDNIICIDCSKKNKRKRIANDTFDIYQYQKTKKKLVNKQKSLISPNDKIRIFREKKQGYVLLDSFLTSYSYKLSLNDQQINKDLAYLRDHQQLETNYRWKGFNYSTSSAQKKKR